MTDRYEKIRKALVKGLTPGPWGLRDGCTDTVENAQGYPVCTVNYHPYERYDHGARAAYIAACDPDTIRALLVERAALVAEVERLRRGAHPAITHCDHCGCDWLDNGLNPVGCPYCELHRETERRWEGNRRATQEYVEDMRGVLKEAARLCEDLDNEALAKEGRLACGAECAAAIADLAVRWNVPSKRT